MRPQWFLFPVFFCLSLHAQPRLTEPYPAPLVARQAVTETPLDNFNRERVTQLFFNQYLKHLNPPLNWTGNQVTCDPGTTSRQYKDAVLAHVNYFRAMAGLPPVAFNDEYSRKAQLSALMISRNKNLSHTPPTTWLCYTTEGAEASSHSNLAYGYPDNTAITGYMDDGGGNNSEVGHRRWILYPPQYVMGTGDVPALDGYYDANALWVLGQFGERPRIPEWVAWPPPGFVPKQIMPADSQRWSFSYPNADFSNARVVMWNLTTGNPMAIMYETRDPGGFVGLADNSVVWQTQFVNYRAMTNDTRYEVTISNVVISGESLSFTYAVTVIDPTFTLSVEKKDNHLIISIPGYTGNFKLLEAREKLGQSAWYAVTNSITVGEGALSIPLPQASRFYRAFMSE